MTCEWSEADNHVLNEYFHVVETQTTMECAYPVFIRMVDRFAMFIH